MSGFIAGLFVGGTLGVLAALCYVAAEPESEDDQPPHDGDDLSEWGSSYPRVDS